MINPEMNKLFSKKFTVMGGTLNLRASRQDLTATNLANIDTPGYRVRHLNFEEELARGLQSNPHELKMAETNKKHLPSPNAEVIFKKAGNAIVKSPYGRDEFDDDILDIDKEMTLLSKNQLIYNTTIQMLAKEFNNLKYAIGEGNAGA